MIVSQPDQPAQPTQSAPEHVTVSIPNNDHQGQQTSGQQEIHPYSHRYIPEEVSHYISQDQSGEIHLSADLNKMFGLGRCLYVLAILEIIGYCYQSFNYFLTFQLYFAFVSLLYIIIPITFFRGYGNLDVASIKSYSVCRVLVIIINIIVIVMFFILFYSKDYNENIAILLIVYVVQFLFNVFLICFPLLLGLLGIYY